MKSHVPVLDLVTTLPGGGSLYRSSLPTGGYAYYSDESGGTVEVWNTDHVSRAALLIAIADDETRCSNTLKDILDAVHA